MNVTADHISALEMLDKDDLVKMVRTMMSGGVVLNFHGKRAAQEIDKKYAHARHRLSKNSLSEHRTSKPAI